MKLSLHPIYIQSMYIITCYTSNHPNLTNLHKSI